MPKVLKPRDINPILGKQRQLPINSGYRSSPRERSTNVRLPTFPAHVVGFAITERRMSLHLNISSLCSTEPEGACLVKVYSLYRNHRAALQEQLSFGYAAN